VRVLGQAAADYLAVLKRDGTTSAYLDHMFDFNQLNDVIGTEALLRTGDRYAAADEQ
jgi:hypothetical protein